MEETQKSTSRSTISASQIHPAWPSVNSLKGVFNKSKQIDPDQPIRQSRTFGNRKGSTYDSDTEQGTNVKGTSEPGRKESSENPPIVKNSLTDESIVRKFRTSFESQKNHITGGNEKPQSKIEINVKVDAQPKILSDDANPQVTHKLESDRMEKKSANDITAAAFKVAQAFGKNNTQFEQSNKLKEVPIPKTRNKSGNANSKPPGENSAENSPQEVGEKSLPVPIPAPLPRSGPVLRTKENRLGLHMKDAQLNDKMSTTASNPLPQTTKPIASVPPSEVLIPREVKISEIVQKWPPMKSVEDTSSKIIQDVENISMKLDDNNNNYEQHNSIASENSTNVKTKLRHGSGQSEMDKFASILVLGLAGSGKSSMIDELLDQQLPKFGKDDIVEHTLHIKVSESNETSHKLRLIDTPGFKNEKFGNAFARMFASLLHYCRNREGMRGKTPSLVLCVVPFEETFLENDNCDFINFLKIIYHFETYFKNQKFPNFIFVLTHLAQADKRDQAYPQLRVDEFLEAIKKYTNLTNRISIVCAENEGEAAGLKVSGGFYKLPNGDMYPSNLIEEMKILLTRKGHVSLSETVIRSAFGPDYPDSIEHMTSKIIPQIKEDSPAIPQMKQTLKNVFSQIKIEKTEISSLLEVGWENINPDLRASFPSSLPTTQRTLQLAKIRNFIDLPTETEKIFRLLRELPQNLAVSDLLIHTLQLKIPQNTESLFIGQGYDLSQDRRTNLSPLQFTNTLKTSPIGQIPEEIQCHATEDRAVVFKFFHSPEDYVQDRMRELGIRHATFPGNPPMPTLKRPGYNFVKEGQTPTKTTVATALLEYRAFRLTLQESDEGFAFKQVFWEALSTQPQLDSKIPETVQSWKEFFNCWGTHLVKSAYGGGSIEINFRGKMLSKVFSSLDQADTIPSDEDTTNRVFQWITGDGLDFILTSSSEGKGDFLKGLDVQACLRGGDEKFNDVDFTKLPYEQVTEMRDEWKENLFVRPAMLETNLVLVPISYFVRQKCEVTALKMDMAFHYIYSQFLPQADTKRSGCNIL